MLIKEWKDQNIITILSCSDLILACGRFGYAPRLHIGNRIVTHLNSCLREFAISFWPIVLKLELIAKISSKLHKMSAFVTAGSKALKST